LINIHLHLHERMFHYISVYVSPLHHLCIMFPIQHILSQIAPSNQPTLQKPPPKHPKTTMDSNVVSPTTGSSKTVMKTPLIYSERCRRRRRWPPPSPPLPWWPPPTQATSTLANHGCRRLHCLHSMCLPNPIWVSS